MTQKPFDAEAYVEQAAALAGLSIPAECRAGVIDNLRRAHGIAQAFLHIPLPDDTEPGSVFTPGMAP
ncbi:DUF4089 domain-containing protein [Ferrovibrio sp.]|uniref:DUF4089 domain-containing protein n=1 Tax=Ferrovibrio sp. TaxID=1917215 RepID=UPI0025BECC92|nr:DUF4089 domain-containing protein [Ferrovibrio sp.]MBX3453819.1 DUF4089 domain-containing protein [Ferrovibrio sp.]